MFEVESKLKAAFQDEIGRRKEGLKYSVCVIVSYFVNKETPLL